MWWLLVIMIGLACSAQASEVWVIQPVSPCLSNACVDRQFEIPIGETRIYLPETDESFPLSCVARMQEAMRAIEPYVLDVERGFGHYATRFADLEDAKRNHAATELFDGVMRDCVRTP